MAAKVVDPTARVDGPKAAGCLIRRDDFDRICYTLSAYGAQLGCGSSNAMLGLSIPILALRSNLPPSTFGPLFAFAGCGYFVGLWVSLQVIEYRTFGLKISKTSLACISIGITAIAQASLIFTENLFMMKLLSALVFFGMGGVDNFSSVALMEMWGQRVQPWMQAKSALYAAGGVIPPLLLQYYSPHFTYAVIVMLCLSAVLGIIMCRVFRHRNRNSMAEESAGERTTLTQTPRQQRNGRTRRLSSELGMLEDMLSNKEMTRTEESKAEVVQIALDGTEYCNVGLHYRENPNFEPRIVKTLSFATSKIIKELDDKIVKDPDSPSPIHTCPFFVRCCLVTMMFIYLGNITAFAGWMPTYIEMAHLGHGRSAAAAFIASIFFSSTLLGSVVSIPCTVFFSTTKMIRTQLSLAALGSVIVLLGGENITHLCIGAAVYGFGMSAIVPLSLTVVNDYGYTMDAASIAICIMGGAIGASTIPPFMGLLMNNFNAEMFLVCTFVFSFALVALYARIHYFLLAHPPMEYSSSHISEASSEREENTYQIAKRQYSYIREGQYSARNSPLILEAGRYRGVGREGSLKDNGHYDSMSSSLGTERSPLVSLQMKVKG